MMYALNRFASPEHTDVGGREAVSRDRQLGVCAVQRRRFPVGETPTRPVLQPEATGATVEVTRRLKPSGNACHEVVTARVCRPQRE